MLATQFIKHVQQNRLFSGADRLIVAVSGGIDSVALCQLCFMNGFTFEIAHVNFGLRGLESDDDETFVRKLAVSLGARFHVLHTDTRNYASENRISIQVAARQLRYQWFDELLQHEPGYLLTAHHADDNIETVMMHFFRGTGIHGLAGIPEKSGRYIRPLLPFGRDEIIHFAQQQGLAWREDSSNESDKYTRNFFRLNVIPLISKVFPEVEKNIAENINRLKEAAMLYDDAVKLHVSKVVEQKGTEFYIPVLKIKKLAPVRTLLYEITKRYGFSTGQLNDIVHLLDAEHGKMVQSETHRIIRNRGWLIIAQRNTTDCTHVIIQEEEQTASFEGGLVRIAHRSVKDVKIKSGNAEALLDARLVAFPLILRKWKAGDYFYPLGMKKKKKISRFLIDQKLSKIEKEAVWVLESAKRICWIVGLRIDDRYKITGATHEVIQVQVDQLRK
jgi:tRNA(Ile)-lysidine synthase